MKIIKTIEEAKKEAFKKLRDIHRQKRPEVRVPVYKDNTENGLATCIIDYFLLKGHYAERIHCYGMPIPVGDGLYKMGKTNQDVGTADVSAVISFRSPKDNSIIRGLSVKIEIKISKDRMSSHQWEYKSKIEKAGGIYIIARTFPQFLVTLHQKIKL